MRATSFILVYSITSLSGPPVGLGLKWSHSGVVLLVRVTGMGLTLSEVSKVIGATD